MSALDLGAGFSFPIAFQDGGFKPASGRDHLAISIMLRITTRRGKLTNGTWSGGERVLRPWFGSNVWQYIDQPINEKTFGMIRFEVYQALKDEDRIQITAIPITSDKPARIKIRVEGIEQNGIAVAFALSYDREMKRWQGQWAA